MSSQFKLLCDMCGCGECREYSVIELRRWHVHYSSEDPIFFAEYLRGDRKLLRPDWSFCRQVEYHKKCTNRRVGQWGAQSIREGEGNPIDSYFRDAKRAFGHRFAVESTVRLLCYFSAFPVGNRREVNAAAVEALSFMSVYETGLVKDLDSWYCPPHSFVSMFMSGSFSNVDDFIDYVFSATACSLTGEAGEFRDIVTECVYELFPGEENKARDVLFKYFRNHDSRSVSYFQRLFSAAASMVLDRFSLSYDNDIYGRELDRFIAQSFAEDRKPLSELLVEIEAISTNDLFFSLPFESSFDSLDCSEDSYVVENPCETLPPSGYDLSDLFTLDDCCTLSFGEAVRKDAFSSPISHLEHETSLDLSHVTNILDRMENSHDVIGRPLPSRVDNRAFYNFLRTTSVELSNYSLGEDLFEVPLSRPSDMVCVVIDELGSTLTQTLYSVLPSSVSMVLIGSKRPPVEFDTGPSVLLCDKLEAYVEICDQSKYHVLFYLNLQHSDPFYEGPVFPFDRGESWYSMFLLPGDSYVYDELFGLPCEVFGRYFDSGGVNFVTGESGKRSGYIKFSDKVYSQFPRLLLPFYLKDEFCAGLPEGQNDGFFESPEFSEMLGKFIYLHCALLGYIPQGYVPPDNPAQPGCWRCVKMKTPPSQCRRHYCVECGVDYFSLKTPPGSAYDYGPEVVKMGSVLLDCSQLF